MRDSGLIFALCAESARANNTPLDRLGENDLSVLLAQTDQVASSIEQPTNRTLVLMQTPLRLVTILRA